MLFAILALAALTVALRLNRQALTLAFVGAFLSVTYPFIKRFLSVPQLYLGLSFGWGIPMAFAAETTTVPRLAWLLFLANLGGWYLAGVLAGAGFFAYQLWLIRGREPAQCLRAFLNNNYFGMAVFSGILLDYLFH